MRYIKIPEPVRFTVKSMVDGKETVVPATCNISELVTVALAPDLKWRVDDAAMTIFLEICDAFEGVKPGDVVELEDGHVELLLKVYREMQLNPEWARASMRVMRAVSSAPKEPQAKPKHSALATLKR